MSLIKSSEEIELIRESAWFQTLGMLAKEINRISTLKLTLAENLYDNDAELLLYDFPNTLCVSPNDQVVHGIPNEKEIENGDILSIDCGVLKNGYFGDHAYTFEVGEVESNVKQLLTVAKESLYLGIQQFKSGNRVGDVGFAIQNHNELNGYGVVRELGHGIGKEMHEKPEIPNGRKGTGKKFKDGMVVAIEPMINLHLRLIN